MHHESRGLRFFSFQWVETARYLGVTMDRGLTWKPRIDQVRWNASQRLGVLSPLLNRWSSLSIGNGVLLYKQLIWPIMENYSPVWRYVAPNHIKSLQVIQCKCLRSATGAPWYVSNLQIHSDLGVPYLAEHIRSIAQSLDSTLPDEENPLGRQVGRNLANQEKWENLSNPLRGYGGLLIPAKHTLHLLVLLREQVAESFLVWLPGGLTPTQETSDDPSTKFYLGLQSRWSFPSWAEAVPTIGLKTQTSRLQIYIIMKDHLHAVPMRVFRGFPWFKGACYPIRSWSTSSTIFVIYK